MAAHQPITQVDAFTDRPFGGNPAAVCVLPFERDATWMQLVAREMNLAETAFLVRRPDGYLLRWFTPTVEVDLCGHATLASAHVLWEDGHLSARAVLERAALRGYQASKRGGLVRVELAGDRVRLGGTAVTVLRGELLA